MTQFIGAIDQGTTSTRFMIFDQGGKVISVAQKEHKQYFPQPGWVEHDPVEIWQRTGEVIQESLAAAGLGRQALAGVGRSCAYSGCELGPLTDLARANFSHLQLRARAIITWHFGACPN